MNTLPPDPHLQAALRHAPDAERSAPPELSAQILAAAHRSAQQRPATAAPAAARPGLSAWWAVWTRPGPRTALATLLMAGFVGLLWRGETPGPAADGPAATVPAAKPVAEPPARVVAQMAAAPEAEAPASPAAPVQARAPAEPATPLAAPPEARERAARASKPPAPAPTSPAAAAVAAAPAPAPEPERALAPVAAPNPTPPAARPAAAALADAGSKPALLPMRPDASEAVVVSATQHPAPAPMATRTARLVAPPSLAASMAALPADTTDPARLAPPWAAQALPASRWQQVDPSTDAVDLAWLQALARATQGRWQPAEDRRPTDAARLLLGWRGETERGRLWLEARSVLWCPTAGVCQRALLSEAEALELRNRLPR
jgi:hypothetical protein